MTRAIIEDKSGGRAAKARYFCQDKENASCESGIPRDDSHFNPATVVYLICLAGCEVEGDLDIRLAEETPPTGAVGGGQ